MLTFQMFLWASTCFCLQLTKWLLSQEQAFPKSSVNQRGWISTWFSKLWVTMQGCGLPAAIPTGWAPCGKAAWKGDHKPALVLARFPTDRAFLPEILNTDGSQRSPLPKALLLFFFPLPVVLKVLSFTVLCKMKMPKVCFLVLTVPINSTVCWN